jgi:hypothetical protein
MTSQTTAKTAPVADLRLLLRATPVDLRNAEANIGMGRQYTYM